LPPSDPPDHSASDSESGQNTPIPRMPALTSLLGAAEPTDFESESSPPPASPRTRPSLRGSSVPPQDPPSEVDILAEHPTSDDLWSPRKESLYLRERREAQRQQSRVANRAAQVRLYSIR
jgi:hypothetical protein